VGCGWLMVGRSGRGLAWRSVRARGWAGGLSRRVVRVRAARLVAGAGRAVDHRDRSGQPRARFRGVWAPGPGRRWASRWSA